MTPAADAPTAVSRLKKRTWLPFVAAAIFTVGQSVFLFHPCQCWFGTVLKKAFVLVLLSVGLLAIRHAVAAVRREERFPWILYLILTLATPFIVAALVEIAVGSHAN